MTGWHGFPRKNAHRPNGAVFFFFFRSHTCSSLQSRVPPMPCLGTTGVRPASRARRLAAGLGQCSPRCAGCCNRRGPKRAAGSAGAGADATRRAGTAAGDTRRREPAGASTSTHGLGLGPAEASDGNGAHPSARAPRGRPRCEGPTPAPDSRPGPKGPPKAGPSFGPRHQARPRRATGRRRTTGPAATPPPAALLSVLPRWAAIAAAALPAAQFSPRVPPAVGSARGPRGARGARGRLWALPAGQGQATRPAKRMLRARHKSQHPALPGML